MATQLKIGTMLRYKKRIFGKDWREEYVMLFNDSTLIWFKDKGRSEPDGGIVIKDSPELMAYGQFTARVPGRPELPAGYKMSQLIAFGTRGRDLVHWFLCKSEEEVIEWMTVISNTLPPPPQPPQNTTTHPASTQLANSQYGTNQPPPPYQQYPVHGPLQQPFHPNTAPAYNGYFRSPQMTAQPNNTTVVIQQQDRRNDADFAMGLMVGGALGWGWGHGWGWGGGGGWGWGGSGFHQDTTTIENHFDVNNTIINNDYHQESLTLHDDYDTSAFDSSDFDCGADFIAF